MIYIYACGIFLNNHSPHWLHPRSVHCWGPEDLRFWVWSCLGEHFSRNQTRSNTGLAKQSVISDQTQLNRACNIAWLAIRNHVTLLSRIHMLLQVASGKMIHLIMLMEDGMLWDVLSWFLGGVLRHWVQQASICCWPHYIIYWLKQGLEIGSKSNEVSFARVGCHSNPSAISESNVRWEYVLRIGCTFPYMSQ